MEVQLCTSCIRSSAEVESSEEVQKFIEDVIKALHERRPEVPWRILPTGCQRFCPPQRITLVVSAQLMMAREASVNGVVEQILRIQAKFAGSV